MEYLVKNSKKARSLDLKRRHLKITVLTSYTPYPSRKIRRICACTSLKTTKEQDSIRLYTCLRALYATYHSTGSSDTDQIVSLVGPAGDLWDQRVRCQLIGKDLVSGLLVYEFPLSSKQVEIAEVTNIPCDLKKEDDSEQQMSHESHESDDDMEYDPSDVEFTEWPEEMMKLNSLTKNPLILKMKMKLTDNGAWKEPAPVEHYCEPFNYKIGCSEWPTCSWRDDGYCNRGNLPGAYIVGNALRYQDFKRYKALKDGKLKEEALKNKSIMEGIIEDEDNESSNEGWRR
ncbi:hypothetical protein Tco_0646096 [Tanacetum coccineum]